MVGPDRANLTGSSQSHASPPSAPLIMLSRRSRTGSARALNTRARASAWVGDSALPTTGMQQSSGTAFAVARDCLDTLLS
jgi:hypothetical protein